MTAIVRRIVRHTDNLVILSDLLPYVPLIMPHWCRMESMLAGTQRMRCCSKHEMSLHLRSQPGAAKKSPPGTPIQHHPS